MAAGDGKSQAQASHTGPVFFVSDAQPRVPLYTVAQFEALAQPAGSAQTVLRVVCRPVREHERLTVVKRAVESVLGQTLYHMGVLDVGAQCVYHFNDPVGGNAAAGAAAGNGADAKAGAAAVAAAAAAAAGDTSAGAAAGAAPSSFLSSWLPAGLQADKTQARWVACPLGEFARGAAYGEPLLVLGLRLTLAEQTRALQHAVQMAATYAAVGVGPDDVPAYDALHFNCQHMTFQMLGPPWSSAPGQANLLVHKAACTAHDSAQWVADHPKTAVALGAAAGVVVGLLYTWATGGSSAAPAAPVAPADAASLPVAVPVRSATAAAGARAGAAGAGVSAALTVDANGGAAGAQANGKAESSKAADAKGKKSDPKQSN